HRADAHPQPACEDRRNRLVLYPAACHDGAAETLLGIRADHFWEDFPKDAAYQPVGRQSPHFTGAQVHIDNIPLAVDRTESVSDSFKDFLGYADKSEFFCWSNVFII